MTYLMFSQTGPLLECDECDRRIDESLAKADGWAVEIQPVGIPPLHYCRECRVGRHNLEPYNPGAPRQGSRDPTGQLTVNGIVVPAQNLRVLKTPRQPLPREENILAGQSVKELNEKLAQAKQVFDLGDDE